MCVVEAGQRLSGDGGLVATGGARGGATTQLDLYSSPSNRWVFRNVLEGVEALPYKSVAVGHTEQEKMR